MLGSVMCLSTCTRPDMTYAVSTLAQFSINPNPEHFSALKYLFGYVKYTTSKGLLFKCLDTEALDIQGFADTDWAGDHEHRKSTSGIVITCNGTAFSWTAKRQTATANSSTESEYVAAAMAIKEVIWLRNLLYEFEQFLDPGKAVLSKPQILSLGLGMNANSWIFFQFVFVFVDSEGP